MSNTVAKMLTLSLQNAVLESKRYTVAASSFSIVTMKSNHHKMKNLQIPDRMTYNFLQLNSHKLKSLSLVQIVIFNSDLK